MELEASTARIASSTLAYSLQQPVSDALKLGTVGFGGPAALIGYKTTDFIGYLIAGLPGAVVAAIGTFCPCYFFTVMPAPYVKRYDKRRAVTAFVDAATATAIGTITDAVIVPGRRSKVDMPTLLLALATMALLWKSKKLRGPIVVAAAAAIRLVLFETSAHSCAITSSLPAGQALPPVSG